MTGLVLVLIAVVSVLGGLAVGLVLGKVLR